MAFVASLVLVGSVTAAPLGLSLAAGTPLDAGGPAVLARTSTKYSNMVLPGQNGGSYQMQLGFFGEADDFTTAAQTPFLLSSMRFVGGVTDVNCRLSFFFFDMSGTPCGSFQRSFTQTGLFAYTFADLESQRIMVPTSGWLQVLPSIDNAGAWVLNSATPTIGSTMPDTFQFPSGYLDDSGHYCNYKFELNAVPEPTAFMCMSFAGWLLRRR
jgi:hypothetical protein